MQARFETLENFIFVPNEYLSSCRCCFLLPRKMLLRDLANREFVNSHFLWKKPLNFFRFLNRNKSVGWRSSEDLNKWFEQFTLNITCSGGAKTNSVSSLSSGGKLKFLNPQVSQIWLFIIIIFTKILDSWKSHYWVV